VVNHLGHGRSSRKRPPRSLRRAPAATQAELAKNAPPIDYAASFDSLDLMERVMRHFYLRALIEEANFHRCTIWLIVPVSAWKYPISFFS
jgi:hypothetical protein